jgi:hypothetical protein
MEKDAKTFDIEIKKVKRSKGQKKTADLRYSNFLITINSHKSVNKMDEEQAEAELTRFETVIDNLVNQDIRDMLVLTSTRTELNMKDVPLKDRILNVKLEYVVEVGSQKGFIHTHIMVAITHRALNVKINLGALRDDYLPDKLGYFPYVNITVFRDAQQIMKDYIRKTSDESKF